LHPQLSLQPHPQELWIGQAGHTVTVGQQGCTVWQHGAAIGQAAHGHAELEL